MGDVPKKQGNFDYHPILNPFFGNRLGLSYDVNFMEYTFYCYNIGPNGCELVPKLTCIFFSLEGMWPKNHKLTYYLAHAYQIVN